MKRSLCVLLALALCLGLLSVLPARAGEDAFRVLLIGSRDSEDAADAGRDPEASRLMDILRAMLGDDAEITLGLCLLEGASMAEHAVQAREDGRVYVFETMNSRGGWTSETGVSSARALEWADWDAVILQPNTDEAATGQASPLCVEGYFYSMGESCPFLLDHVQAHAPGAETYLFVPWSRTEETKPGAGLEEYSRIANFMPRLMALPETEGSKGFAGLVPVGAAVQNARSTYLAALDYTGEGDALPDRQIGLQRDGEQLSLYLGRYIAALTLAETVVPEGRRVKGYALPPIGAAPSLGALPAEYTKLARTAARSAVSLWREKGSLAVSPIPGFETDPVLTDRRQLDGAKIPMTACSREPEHLTGALKKTLTDRLFEVREQWPELEVQVRTPELSGEYPLYAAVTVLRFGYAATEFTVSGRVEFTESGHIWSRWLQPTAPTCTEPGLELHYCCICGTEETRPAEPLGHDFGSWSALYEPSCTLPGTAIRYCSRCTATETKPILPRGHEYADAVTEPTCTEPGYTTHTCIRCGDSYRDAYKDPLVGIEVTPEGLILKGLPEGAEAAAAGFDESGRLVLLRLLRGEEARLSWPEAGKPPVLKIFFVDGEGLPLSAPWTPAGE